MKINRILSSVTLVFLQMPMFGIWDQVLLFWDDVKWACIHQKKPKNAFYLQGTWNTCQKICTWWLTKKKSTWMQKEVMHNLIYTLHKTLNLWHSIGHQSQTLPEFKSETSRLLDIFWTKDWLCTLLNCHFWKKNLKAWFLKDPKKKHDMDLIKMKSSDRAVTLCWYSNTVYRPCSFI